VALSSTDRRLVLALAAALYGAVLAAFVLVERPGLGIAHFFYIPVCIVALAFGERRGALAGSLATALYALAVFITPAVPSAQLFTTSTLIRLVTYCGIGALVGRYASSNRRLVGELRSRALEDFVTGIGNARMFDEELARRCALGLPFTLVLADLDGFGEINTTHGHEAGNAALRRVAQAMRETTRRSDAVARVGGDEFALMTDVPAGQTPLICARISRAVSSENVHLSFGTTSFPDDGTTAVELFRKADDRLFAAKLVNRNRRTVVALS
jgi:diguanylate cyclase (GGDEF)-like protein